MSVTFLSGIKRGSTSILVRKGVTLGILPRALYTICRWEVRLVRCSRRCIHSPAAIVSPGSTAQGTQAGSLCYINAGASSLQVHGDSSQDGSGRSLEGKSIRCHDDHWSGIPITWIPVPTIPKPSMPVAVMPISLVVAAIVVMIISPMRLSVLA